MFKCVVHPKQTSSGGRNLFRIISKCPFRAHQPYSTCRVILHANEVLLNTVYVVDDRASFEIGNKEIKSVQRVQMRELNYLSQFDEKLLHLAHTLLDDTATDSALCDGEAGSRGRAPAFLRAAAVGALLEKHLPLLSNP